MAWATFAQPELVALLEEPLRSELSRSPRLMQLLEQALARTAAAGPNHSLLHYLAERFPSGGKLEATLPAWCTEDLRLCHDCIAGDAEAVASFEARVRPVIRSTLARLRLAEPLREELEQSFLVQLVVGDQGRPPLIGSYKGLGKLEHWVRVVVGRQGRKALGREKHTVPDAELAGRLIDPQTGADLAGEKNVYRQVFAEALRRAVATLEPRQATLLRQRYADGLTLQQIGAVYRVHHETARRWLEEVHRTLLASTRALMAERLAISAKELDTVMHMIRTGLDLTLHTFFAKGSGA